jgi:asparagine synthase (glutamine-hydrolysing)
MCGIVGFVGDGDRSVLKRMADILIHRGPDAEGYFIEAATQVHLGHRRLSILDHQGGAQPMWTADEQIGVVFNGEIYNFAELRDELTRCGHRFDSDHSDTEVLLYGYREWGPAFVNRLNGMWAFCLYDKRERNLFLSRDRFGKKPLYYTLQNGIFAFSSELNALLAHPQLRFSISEIALQKYFAYGHIPAPASLYREAAKLPPGHSMVFDLQSQRSRTWQYWDLLLEPSPLGSLRQQEQLAEELSGLIDRAVRRRMVSDVPIGVFLSGGIDSSSIAAAAASELPSGALKTFSIGFDDPTYDETPFAASVADLLATSHSSQSLSIDRAIGLLPEIYGRLDEPMGDSSLLPTYLLAKHTREHVTVALGGDGADELFGGYAPFKALKWAQLYQRLVPRSIHPAVSLILGLLPVSHGYMSLDFKIKRALRAMEFPPSMWNPIWMSSLTPDDFQSFFGAPVALEEVFSEAIDAWERCAAPSLIDKSIMFFSKLYLPGHVLTKVDRASMLNSLEVRAPFLDIELVDFARKLPHEMKYRGGTTKYILRRAMAQRIPAAVIKRGKQGFAVPIGKWFKEGAVPFPILESRELNPRKVRLKLESHLVGKSDQSGFLWNYWVLQHFISGAQPERPVGSSRDMPAKQTRPNGVC